MDNIPQVVRAGIFRDRFDNLGFSVRRGVAEDPTKARGEDMDRGDFGFSRGPFGDSVSVFAGRSVASPWAGF